MPFPTQSLQPSDVRADEGFRILALSFELLADAPQMLARAVDLILLADVESNIAISGSRSENGRRHLHDHVAANVLQMRSVGKFHVVDAAVYPIDYQIDPLVDLIASQPFGQDSTCDFSRSAGHRDGRIDRRRVRHQARELRGLGAWS